MNIFRHFKTPNEGEIRQVKKNPNTYMHIFDLNDEIPPMKINQVYRQEVVEMIALLSH